jgi:hypothetical protein
MLKPLLFENLAYPSGIALSPDDRVMCAYLVNVAAPYTFDSFFSFFPCSYVAEMMQNRVLRFVQRPTGVFHVSVFYQFSGRIGPSAIVVDREGFIYVARYDLRGDFNNHL